MPRFSRSVHLIGLWMTWFRNFVFGNRLHKRVQKESGLQRYPVRANELFTIQDVGIPKPTNHDFGDGFFFSALAVGCTTSLRIMIGHYNDCHWVFIQSTILRLKFVSSHFTITLFCGAFSFALYLRFSFPSFWGTAPAFLKTSIFGIFPPVLVSF